MSKKLDTKEPDAATLQNEIRMTRAYMENLLEGVLDCAAQLKAEEERSDRLHKARKNRLRNRFEELVEEYANCMTRLQELQQARRL